MLGFCCIIKGNKWILQKMERRNRMNLGYFQEFLVLADTKNFWEASERLFIGQSTLTRHIKLMEEELGVPLFNRTSRHVELTTYGRLLIPYAQTIVRTQLDYTERIQTQKNADEGNVVLGVIPSMVPYRLTDLLVGFQKIHPEATVRVLESDTLDLKQQLMENKCTMAFLRETDIFPISELEMIKIPFTKDKMVALLPVDHPLSGSATLRLEQLKNEKFVMMSQNTLLRQIGVDACLRCGFRPNIVFDCERMDSLFDLVSRGVGVSLLMNHHLAQPAYVSWKNDEKGLTAVEITPAVSSQTCLCYRKDGEMNQTARDFFQYTREQVPLLFQETRI
jgi:DNA-binding transcriptional LysR family regulator